MVGDSIVKQSLKQLAICIHGDNVNVTASGQSGPPLIELYRYNHSEYCSLYELSPRKLGDKTCVTMKNKHEPNVTYNRQKQCKTH